MSAINTIQQSIQSYDHYFFFNAGPSTSSFHFFVWITKIIPVQRGYGKRQQWKITMHDGVPSVAQPWFQYLSENNLMAGDEVIFFFRFDEHVWGVVFRKEVIWDDENLSR